MESRYKKIKILAETKERSFKGWVYTPADSDSMRLSDYLNAYPERFLRLADVEVTNRGQHYRVGEHVEFAAVAMEAITFVTPLEDELPAI